MARHSRTVLSVLPPSPRCLLTLLGLSWLLVGLPVGLLVGLLVAAHRDSSGTLRCSALLIAAHRCSSLLIAAHRCSSLLIAAHRCSSLLIAAPRCSSLLLGAPRGSSGTPRALLGHASLLIIAHRCSSLPPLVVRDPRLLVALSPWTLCCCLLGRSSFARRVRRQMTAPPPRFCRWAGLRDALTNPLQTEQVLEEALLEVGRAVAAGHAPPRSLGEAVASVRQQARGPFLAELASTVWPNGAPESTRQARGRKRPRVDGLTLGARVSRWAQRADSLCMDPPALDLAPEQAQQAPLACVEIDLNPRTGGGRTTTINRGRKAVWQPGHDSRGVLGRGRGGVGRISPQTRTLLVNGYLQLQKRPRAQRARLRQIFPAMGEGKAATTSSQILSGLLRVPVRTVENTVARALGQGSGPRLGRLVRLRLRTGHGRRPAGKTPDADAAKGSTVVNVAAAPVVNVSVAPVATVAAGPVANVAAGPAQATAARGPTEPTGLAAGFVNVVRVSQFISSHGLSKTLLPNILYLIVAAKGDIGRGPHCRRFCSVAEAAADALLLRETALLLQRPLPGTGRPPDVEVFADGGTVGQYYSSGRDQVLVVGAAVSTPWWPYTASLLIACVIEKADGRASATEKHLAEAFEGLGCGSFDHWRSERFSVAIGDQALAPGGPAHTAQNLGLRLLWDGHRCQRDVADLFHLINRAGKRALEQPAAQALFSLLKNLEHSFGLGHGRHLDRSVAAFLGETQLACKSPVGHRKTGYLCGVPERFLQKYRNFFYGVLVRMNHALDNRGSKSFSWLKELGEQLSDQTTVTFALGLVSGLAHNLAAVSLRSQNAGDLPWTRWRALRRNQQSMEQEVVLLGWWRERLTCVALLEAFLPRTCSGLRNWWKALCFSPAGRRVCSAHSGIHLGCQLFTMLFSGVFKGCALQAATWARGAGARVAHPACQCCTMPRRVPGSATVARGGGRIDPRGVASGGVGRVAADPGGVGRVAADSDGAGRGAAGSDGAGRGAAGSGRVGRGAAGSGGVGRDAADSTDPSAGDAGIGRVAADPGGVGRLAVDGGGVGQGVAGSTDRSAGGAWDDCDARRGGERVVRVPRWVSRTLYSRRKLRESAACEDPSVCLPRWQCYDNSSTAGLANRACSVPIRAEVGLAHMDAGLTQLQHFWRTFAADFEQCCLGDIGVSTDMQQIFDAMATCWWLEDVVQIPRPTSRHEEALVTLWDHLKADMRKKSWPPAEYRQSPTTQQWPNRRGIVEFYRKWWQQVHAAAHSPSMVFRERWRPVVAFEVCPVRSTRLLQQVGRVICAPRTGTRGPQSRSHRGGCRRRARESAATRGASLHITAVLHSFLYGLHEHAFLVPANALHCLDHGTGRGRRSETASGVGRVAAGSREATTGGGGRVATGSGGVGRVAAGSTDPDLGGVGQGVAGSEDHGRGRAGRPAAVSTDAPRPDRVSFVGRIAALHGPRLRGRVVRVIREKREWDQGEITASLEQDSSFATGCYYVNALFCLSRRFGSTEAPCERLIGGLKYLYHPVQGPTTTALVQRLRARAAGVRGNGADEDFIQRLAHELSGSQGSSVHARGLHTFQTAARRSLEVQAPWLLQLGTLRGSTVDAPQRKGYKQLERAAKEARNVHEPRILEEADRRFVCAERDRGMARMPLFAATRRQWEQDRALPQMDLRRSQRAQTACAKPQPPVAAAAARPAVAAAAAEPAVAAAVARPAVAAAAAEPAVAASGAAPATEARPSSTSSSSSSSSDSSPSSSSSESPTDTAAAAAASGGPCPWVAPRGPHAKLHWRIDLGGGQHVKLCKPATEVAVSCLGDTIASAEATGRAWCPACLCIRSPQDEAQCTARSSTTQGTALQHRVATAASVAVAGLTARLLACPLACLPACPHLPSSVAIVAAAVLPGHLWLVCPLACTCPRLWPSWLRLFCLGTWLVCPLACTCPRLWPLWLRLFCLGTCRPAQLPAQPT